MQASPRPLAVVTGASSGIGYNLARICAENGFDLVVAADQPLDEAAMDFRALGAQVDTVETELASRPGVDKLYAAIKGRAVDALLANAGHGLGRDFLEQEFNEVLHTIDTNITGTIYLVQKVATDMRARGQGRILITGAMAGFMPGSHQAVYKGTEAFIDSFSAALRDELKDTGVTLTCLMPGVTDTDFFVRADMLDVKGTQEDKADPSEVARTGFEAMMAGEADVVAGLKNKPQVAEARVKPSQIATGPHRKMVKPSLDSGIK